MPRFLTRRLATGALIAALVVSCGGPGPSATGADRSAEPSSSTSPAATPSGDASASPGGTAPSATVPPASERLTILLVGFDNTTERERSELTDTVILASLDRVAGTASLLGLPRDLSDYPLPDGSV